jgi:hypothetical protein
MLVKASLGTSIIIKYTICLSLIKTDILKDALTVSTTTNPPRGGQVVPSGTRGKANSNSNKNRNRDYWKCYCNVSATCKPNTRNDKPC